jgi:hypothetical protein
MLVHEMGAVKPVIGLIFTLLPLLLSCHRTDGKAERSAVPQPYPRPIIDTAGQTILQRFQPPEGFTRTRTDSASFGFYLRYLPLKTFGTPVRYYDGRSKPNADVYISVVDMDIGDRDLQQCADAIMRLRAEYLYARQRYQDIHFTFVSDGKPRYYEDYHDGDPSYEKFREYLEFVFNRANTRSLSRELVKVESISAMQVGNVFIRTGDPYGHAVIVVDMAENRHTGEKVYLLAQSYMPAQDIQILLNRADPKISPWYRLGEGPIVTPEWTFSQEDLRRFGN